MRRFKFGRWLLLAVTVAVLIVGGRSLSAQSITAIPFEPQLAVEEQRSGEAIAHASESELFNEALDWIAAAEQAYHQRNFLDASAKIDEAIRRLETLSPTVDQQDKLALSLDLSGAISFDRSRFAEALIAWQEAADIYGVLAGTEARMHLRSNRVNQAQALQSNGQFEQACEILLQNVELKDFSCEAVSRAIVKYHKVQELGPDETVEIDSSETVIINRLIHQPVTDWIDVHTRLNLGDLLRKGGHFESAIEVLQRLQRNDVELSKEDRGEILLALANTVRSQGDFKRAQAAAGLGIQFSANFCPSLNGVKKSEDWPELYKTAIHSYDEIHQTFGTDSEIGLKAWINSENLQLALDPDIERIAIEMRSFTPEQIRNPRLQKSLLNYAQLFRCYAQAARDAGDPNKTRLTTKPLALWQDLFTNYLQQAIDLVEAIVNTNQIQGNSQILSYGYGYLGEFKEFEYNTLNLESSAQKNEGSQDPLLISARDLTEQALQWVGDSDILRYQWLWQMGRILHLAPTKKLKLDALDYYQSAYAALQSLRNDLVAFNQSIQYDFRDRVEPLYREYVDLLLTPEIPGNEISQDRLKDARKAIESLQLAELDQFFQDDCTQFANTDVGTVDDKAAFFFTIFLHDRLEIIVSIPDQDNLLHKPIQENPEEFGSFESTISSLQTILSGGKATQNFKKNSSQVYDWLIRPFLADLQADQIKTLVFSLDDVLQGLPIAALLDNSSDKPEYLIDKDFLLAVVPSSRIFPPRKIRNVNIKILGAALSDFEKYGDTWPDLRYTEPEICNIKLNFCLLKQEIKKETCPGDDGSCKRMKTLLAQGFDKETLKKELQSGEFSIVHIATHGQFSSDQNETFLLAADDKLHLQELAEMFDSIPEEKRRQLELLVLSACKTAEGNSRAALGMAGMALRSGAQSTIASLWSVEDRSTMELMGEFYNALKQSPEQGKAYALREAQLSLKQQTRYSDPSYWAPFVLIGNWL
ncbi:MAG: CHAT domain-containing protein [Cyanobacteria bacterium P01_G01_bin.54]